MRLIALASVRVALPSCTPAPVRHAHHTGLKSPHTFASTRVLRFREVDTTINRRASTSTYTLTLREDFGSPRFVFCVRLVHTSLRTPRLDRTSTSTLYINRNNFFSFPTTTTLLTRFLPLHFVSLPPASFFSATRHYPHTTAIRNGGAMVV